MLLQAPLVMPTSPFSPVRIGNIYQRFGSLDSGLCQNIIKASVPFVLEEGMYTYATGHAYAVSTCALYSSLPHWEASDSVDFLMIWTGRPVLAASDVSKLCSVPSPQCL